MADVKISELTALTSPDGAEELVVNDGGTTKKITITNATSASLARAGGTMTGVIAGFESTGIDDNATSTVIQIEDDGDVLLKSGANYAWIRAWEATTGNMIIGADTSSTGSGGSALILKTRGAERVLIDSTGIDVTGSVNDSSGNVRAGRKNLIINGSMQVAQRGTSVTGVGNGDNGFHTCDRWQYVESGDTGSVFTLTQSTDAPSGFGNSMKFDCTTAESTLAANEQLRLRYKFEGQDLQQLKKGTSEAESFTLSFWVKSHTTGAAAVCFYAANRQISALYTINSSATWEKKTITFSGDSTTAIPNDANDGFQLWFQLFAGSQYTSGTLPTSWATYNENNNAVGQVLNIASSTDNYFQVTGVQLELGSGTDFEHRSYGEELLACQRYYQVYGGTSYATIASGFQPNRTNAKFHLSYMQEMRAVPSIGTANSAELIVTDRTGFDQPLAGFGGHVAGKTSAYISVTMSAVGTQYAGILLAVKNGTTTTVNLDAEL